MEKHTPHEKTTCVASEPSQPLGPHGFLLVWEHFSELQKFIYGEESNPEIIWSRRHTRVAVCLGKGLVRNP